MAAISAAQDTEVTQESYLLPEPSTQLLKVSLTKKFLANKKKRGKQKKVKPLEFVHIPKTGGTAMEWSAGRRNITWGYCNFGLRRGFPGCENPPFLDKDCGGTCWHQPSHKLPEVFTRNKAVFAVVRNPYERIISEYYCPWANGYHGPNKTLAKTLNWYIQDRIMAYRNHSLEPDPELHMLPQSVYIFGNMKKQIRQQVDHILFYEDLDNQLAKLMKQYNLNLKLDGIENVGTHNNSKFTVADFNSKSIALLNDFYGTDFDYLGYHKINPNIAAQQQQQQHKEWAKTYPITSIYMT